MMNEWIDEKIAYLHSKIGEKFVLFEPTKEFYEKLEKIEIIPPLDQVLKNIDENRPPFCTFDEATKDLGIHLGRDIPKIKFYPMKYAGGGYTAGKIQVRGEFREIQISSDYKRKAKQLGTILAHELAHDFLFSKNIVLSNSDENERFTDLATIMLGFGKLMLNGIEEKTYNATKKLCYLSSSDLAYAYTKVNSLYNVNCKARFTNLDSSAYSLIKSFDEINIKMFVKTMINDIDEKSSLIQTNLDKTLEIYYEVKDNQELINKNIGNIKIEPMDGRIFVNLNSPSFQPDFENFVSSTKSKLIDIKKEMDGKHEQISVNMLEVTIQHLENLKAQINQNMKEEERYLAKLFEVLSVQERYFPKKSKLLESRFQELVKQGRLNEALKIAAKEDGKTLNNLGVKFAKKKDKIAIDIFQKILQLDPYNALTYYNLGKLYRDLNMDNLALENYYKSIKFEPNNAMAYYNCGNIHLNLKQYFDAIGDYQMTIKLDPNHAMAYYNCGEAHFHMKHYLEAIESYQAAIKLDPNNTKIYCSCGDAHFNSQHYQEAKENYQMALKIDPHLPNLRDKIRKTSILRVKMFFMKPFRKGLSSR